MPAFRKSAKFVKRIFLSQSERRPKRGFERRFKIQSSPGRFFSFARSFRPSREDDRKAPHFRVAFLASIVLGTREKGESARSIQRDLKAGRSLPKRQPEKRFSVCSLFRFRSFPFAKKRTTRERRRKNCFVFASEALCATREAAHSFRRRRRHQKQRDC